MNEKTNLADSAYLQLKRDITSGAFKPDDKLLMSHLRDRYEIGTGPMREALSRLVAEHLVTAASQRGFRVAAMSTEELHDIYFARASLEAMIAELAVQKGDDSWEASVIASAHTLSRVEEVENAEQMLSLWDSRHKAFHNAIASGCGSNKLMELRTTMLDQAERYRQLWLKHTVFSPEALADKRNEHKMLIETLLSRDTKKVRTLVFEHMMNPIPIIEDILQEQGLAG
ncbi:DNA-binding transcriptional regulator CsiR [Marinobacterium stanieri]|uniref:DNA-binding transcriptional regulator CsiR n=1 Tax=Marinobacterium stanieri TaxID=49186 RepID=UPI003A93C179